MFIYNIITGQIKMLSHREFIINHYHKTVEQIAHNIWRERKDRGDIDADDEKKNWKLAEDKFMKGYE